MRRRRAGAQLLLSLLSLLLLLGVWVLWTGEAVQASKEAWARVDAQGQCLGLTQPPLDSSVLFWRFQKVGSSSVTTPLHIHSLNFGVNISRSVDALRKAMVGDPETRAAAAAHAGETRDELLTVLRKSKVLASTAVDGMVQKAATHAALNARSRRRHEVRAGVPNGGGGPGAEAPLDLGKLSNRRGARRSTAGTPQAGARRQLLAASNGPPPPGRSIRGAAGGRGGAGARGPPRPRAVSSATRLKSARKDIVCRLMKGMSRAAELTVPDGDTLMDSPFCPRLVQYSLHHEVCREMVPGTPQCYFGRKVRQLAIFRDPVDRYVSSYYFWATVHFVHRGKYAARRYNFHGDMSAPPPDMAREYASRYGKVMMETVPGPTYSWAFWSGSAEDGVLHLQKTRDQHFHGSDDILPLLLSRMDESMVLLHKLLGWSLADVVYTGHRKASGHASTKDWDTTATNIMRSKAKQYGEQAMYEAAQAKFERSIDAYPDGRDAFQRDLAVYKDLRREVEERCRAADDSRLARHLLALARHPRLNGISETDYKRAVHIEHFPEAMVRKHRIFNEQALWLSDLDVCAVCEARSILRERLNCSPSHTLSRSLCPA